MTRRLLAWMVVLIFGSLSASCGAPALVPASPTAPSPVPSALGSLGTQASPSPTPGATVPPATSAATPSAAPTPSVPPATAPASPAAAYFPLEWQRREDDFGAGIEVGGSAVIDDRIVVIGNEFTGTGDDDTYLPAIFWEDGDLVWRRADLPEIPGNQPWIEAIARGGPGLVVVGTYFEEDYSQRALLLLSSDGKAWERVPAPGLDDGLWNAESISNGATLASAEGGMILIGRLGGEAGGTNVAFVSADGRTWQRATDPKADQLGYGSLVIGSQPLTGFASRLEPCCVGDVTGGDPVGPTGPVRVVQASSPDDWSVVEELPGANLDDVSSATVGARGWVAIGGNAWRSSDGTHWQPAENGPDGLVCALFGVPTGFVAVTTNGGHCGDPGVPNDPTIELVRADTWTSTDGRTWVVVDTFEAGSAIKTLRRRGDTLIGIGQIDGTDSAVWTAQLP